jgi:F-type H+-transporting ATPase subunit gamma
MPSLKTIRKRIGSVKSTQKITRAMKMVAGARLNRAQQRITHLRPYAIKTSDILHDVAADLIEEAQAATEKGEKQEKHDDNGPVHHAEKGGDLHPLLVKRKVQKALFLLMSSDRGLCGGYNANVSKAAERAWKDLEESHSATVHFATVGKKGRDYVTRRGGNVVRDFTKVYDGLELPKVKAITDWLVETFLKGEYDAIYLVYSEFKSAMTQHPTVEQLLPLTDKGRHHSSKKGEGTSEYIFEPGKEAILEHLVPMYVDITVYRALLEANASELGARMSAMDSATRNAKEMIGKLTLVYNRARQAGITKDLMEIVSGAESLKD